jgi:hypothetical protein
MLGIELTLGACRITLTEMQKLDDRSIIAWLAVDVHHDNKRFTTDPGAAGYISF